MSKRRWTDIRVLEGTIMELRTEGKTRQEIADKLGLGFVQIKNWVNRHNREQKRADAGLPPKRLGHGNCYDNAMA